MTNQRYTEEFRREAVKLALESEKTNREIADNLGVKYKTLMNWLHQSMKNRSPKNIKSIDYKSRYQTVIDENKALQKALKQAKLERDILKKAAAYFASQNM